MKVGGWILLTIGVFGTLGALANGGNPTGGIFWIVVGAYMLHVHNRRQREKEEKEKWEQNK